jgi:hypothetical protein
MWKWIWVPVLAVALCGCFKTKDELTLNADGSGSVRIETRVLVASETLETLGLGMTGGGDDAPSVYPPTSEDEAKRFFPAKDFTVTVKEEKEGQGALLVVTAAFKDVNALLASPYAKAHGLSLVTTNGALSLKAVIGVEAAARLAEMKDDDTGLFAAQMPGLDELKKKKEEMRAEFRVTLPNAAASASAGGTRDGKSVTWIADRPKAKDAAEFAQQTGALLEASCPAEGLKFSPVAPARLGMLSFADAPTGVLVRATTPDTNKIAAAAKFVPCAMQITRTLDLSGEGGSHQNQAQLVGAVVLPHEFAPQKWGEVKIDEVVDAKGTSLKLPQVEDEFDVSRLSGRNFGGGGDDEDAEDGEAKEKKDPEHRHLITLAFQPPDWKVKEIARIKGSIVLQYFSGAQIVKISNAIPAKWIREVKRENDFDFEPRGQAISDPKLPELGLSLKLTMGMSQGSFTSLMFDASGSKATVTDAQVYDADGRPWPTFFMRQGFGGEDAMTVMVAGKPKMPLSLALVASGAGASVIVPILLEKVPVGAK